MALLAQVPQRDWSILKLNDDYKERISNINVHTVVSIASNLLHSLDPFAFHHHHNNKPIYRILWIVGVVLRIFTRSEYSHLFPVVMGDSLDIWADQLTDLLVSVGVGWIEVFVHHLVIIRTASLTFCISIREPAKVDVDGGHYRWKWMPSMHYYERFQLCFMSTLCV